MVLPTKLAWSLGFSIFIEFKDIYEMTLFTHFAFW